MRVSPLASTSTWKSRGTRPGVPSGRVHGFQPSLRKPNMLVGVPDADRVDAERAPHGLLDLGQDLEGLADRHRVVAEAEGLADAVVGARGDAGDGRAAEVDRGAVRLLVPQRLPDPLASVHGVLRWSRDRVARPRCLPRAGDERPVGPSGGDGGFLVDPTRPKLPRDDEARPPRPGDGRGRPLPPRPRRSRRRRCRSRASG